METAIWTRRAAQVIWDVLTPQDDPIKMPQLLSMRAYNSAVRHGAHVAAARRRQHPQLFELPVGEGIQPGPAFDIVARCLSVYRITMVVEEPKDTGFLRRSLQLAVELATAYGGVIRDVQAVRLLDVPTAVAMLKAPSVGWAHTQLYSREISHRDVRRRKIYTRGMVKFGMPDLQVSDVPDPCRKRARAVLRQLIDTLSDFRYETLPLNLRVEDYPVTFVKIPNGDDGFFPYERMELRDYVEPINLIGQTAARVLEFHSPGEGQVVEQDEDDDFVAPPPPPDEVVAANDSPEEPQGPRFRIQVTQQGSRPAPPPPLPTLSGPSSAAPPPLPRQIPPPPPPPPTRAPNVDPRRAAVPEPGAPAPRATPASSSPQPPAAADPFAETHFGELDVEPRRSEFGAPGEADTYQSFADTFSIGATFGEDDLAEESSSGLELHDGNFAGTASLGRRMADDDFTGIGDVGAPETPARAADSPKRPAELELAGGHAALHAQVEMDEDPFVPMIHFFGTSRSTIWVFAQGQAPTLPVILQELMRTKFVLEPSLNAAAPALDVTFRHPIDGFRLSLKVHQFPAGRPLELAALSENEGQRRVLEDVAVRALTTIEGALTTNALTHQAKLAQAVQRATRGVIYDETSQHLWESGNRFNFALVDGVTPAQLVHVHVEPRRKEHEQVVWVHTHGLERLGVPNIDILGLDRLWASRAKQLLEYLVGQIELTGEHERSSLRSFEIEGERLLLMPKSEYLALLQGMELLGARSDANHEDERLVLIDPKAQGTPYPLTLTRVLDLLTRR